MRLAVPWALLLLLPVAWMVVAHFRRRTGGAVRFSSLDLFRQIHPSARQRFIHLPFWLLASAMALLAVALARPQKPSMETGIPKEGIAIELLVDVSSSMDISMPFRETSMSRMEATRNVVAQFAAERPNDLVGLITFARYADTVCPLTPSRDALQYYIENLKIESRPNEDGTAFGDALALAAARLRTAEQRYGEEAEGYTIKSKVVVLLTDGNNNCGRHLPLEGAALAAEWGIRVHTIAITDPPEMKTVETPAGPVQVEADPPVQERVLRKIAETTGGIYRRATDEDSLAAVYAEINAMEKSEIETARYQTYTDAFQPFAAAALLLLAAHAALSTTWLRRIP